MQWAIPAMSAALHRLAVPVGSDCRAGYSALSEAVWAVTMIDAALVRYHPDDYDPDAAEDEKMARDIDDLNDEMVAAGVRVFVGGLELASGAKSLRRQTSRRISITDGPYLETKEHIGGLWILEAADMDEALEWGRKAAIACRAPVEVRAFR